MQLNATTKSDLYALATVAAMCCLLAGCDRRQIGAPKTSPAAMVLKTVGLTLPDEAANVRTFDEALFTLTCVISVEMPTADVPAFLAESDVLPKRDAFSGDEDVRRSIMAMGRAAPWWDLVAAPNVVYAAASGRRPRGDEEYMWTTDAAIVPLDEARSRVYLTYVEEAAID